MEQSGGQSMTDPSSGLKPAFRRSPLPQKPHTSKGHGRSLQGSAAHVVALCSGQGQTPAPSSHYGTLISEVQTKPKKRGHSGQGYGLDSFHGGFVASL